MNNKKKIIFCDEATADELRRELLIGFNQMRRIGEILKEFGVVPTTDILMDCIAMRREAENIRVASGKGLGVSIAPVYECVTVWKNIPHLDEAFGKQKIGGELPEISKMREEHKDKCCSLIFRINEKIREHSREQIISECVIAEGGEVTLRQDFEDVIRNLSSVYFESPAAERIYELHVKAESALNNFHKAIADAAFDVVDVFQTQEDGSVKLVPFDYNRFV